MYIIDRHKYRSIYMYLCKDLYVFLQINTYVYKRYICIYISINVCVYIISINKPILMDLKSK